jgi:hypothetical protein
LGFALDKGLLALLKGLVLGRRLGGFRILPLRFGLAFGLGLGFRLFAGPGRALHVCEESIRVR